MKKSLLVSAALISLISISGMFFSCGKNSSNSPNSADSETLSNSADSTDSIYLTKMTKKGSLKYRRDKNFISVVATTFPCYDAVRAVSGNFLGNKIDLKLLVKPGTEVHSYDPSPADIIAIQNSDLFVFVGGESDEWIENVLNSISVAKTEGQILRLMDFVKTLEEIEFEERGHEHYSHGEEYFSRGSSDSPEENPNELNPHEIDEHIWTSPENEISIVQAVCENLIKAAESKNIFGTENSESENPKHAGEKSKSSESENFGLELENFKDEIKKNAESYKNQIRETADFTNRILSEKQERFILMADRFPFTYFADFYNLGFDAAFSGCSTAVEASTATISRLIDTVKSKNLPAVFYIELGNHKIADTIAESTDTKAILLQSCQNVTKNDFENGETWVSLMKQNAEALKIGLR